MSESMAEKTEKPTPRRRADARKKGTVAKSMDLNGALTLLAVTMIFPFALSQIFGGGMHWISVGLGSIPQTLNPSDIAAYVAKFIAPMLAGLFALMMTIMGVGVAANFAQVGFHLSGEAMKPNFKRLDPAQGIKRLLGSTAVVETLKAGLKFGLFFLVAFQAVKGQWNSLSTLSSAMPAAAITIVASVLKTVTLRVGMVWLIISGMDYGFQRYRTEKSMMMTKDEVKREMKEQETSAEVKTAQMKMRRRLRRGSIKKAVSEASVIITNPTHFSVALKYEVGKDHAPQVLAKGQDLLAFRIREFAKEFNVPIVPNPPLARALHKQCEIGDFVPREYFQAVAEVLAHVFRNIRGLQDI